MDTYWSRDESDSDATCTYSEKDGPDPYYERRATDRRLMNGRAAAGDIVWLPKNAARRLKGFKKLPRGLPGHEFVILDIFRNVNGEDIAWICIVRSISGSKSIWSLILLDLKHRLQRSLQRA